MGQRPQGIIITIDVTITDPLALEWLLVVTTSRSGVLSCLRLATKNGFRQTLQMLPDGVTERTLLGDI